MRTIAIAGVCVTCNFLAVALSAAPTSQPDAKPPAGLAAKYPGDAGVAKDPAVLFAEDFESPDAPTIGKRWTEVSNKNSRALALAADVPGGSAGKQSLAVTATLGTDTGGHLYKVLKPGADRVHARFYVKFAADCPYIHHFVTMGAHRDAPAWPMGEAGKRPDGRNRFTSGLEPWGNWGKYPPPGAWNFYSYWHAMKRSGDGNYWGNSFKADKPEAIPRGRWMCAEMMIAANSAPDKADGSQAFWIDGKLVGRFENIHWRTANDLKINFFWLMLYVTETAVTQNKVADPNKTCRVWFDDVVLATDYIGPIAPIKSDQRSAASDPQDPRDK